MPRPSLPTELKRLQTIDVLLTQTTEEQLWSHFKSMFLIYETKMENWVQIVSEASQQFSLEDNPFHHRIRNWRRDTKPSRKYKDGLISSLIDNMDELELHHTMMNFYIDLLRCNKSLKWDEDEEYRDDFGRMSSSAEFLKSRLRSELDNLADMENLCFNIAERQWKEEDAEWIANHNLEKAHKYHHSRQYYLDLIESDNGAKEWYARHGIPSTDYELVCKFCIQKRKEEEERDERLRLREIELEELRVREEAQKREAERKEAERRKAIPVIHYECDLCDYHTTNRGSYDYHMEGKEHQHKEKMTKLFCKGCGIQSRTQLEFEFHCATIKHKKILGEIEADPEEFVCAPCEYKCGTKMLWKQHCGGKKHLNKTTQS